MNRIFTIGDTHGCLKTLNAMLEKIDFTTDDQLIALGDYVDRGPDSKGVIDRLRKLKQAGYAVEMLRGNHEEMLINNCFYEKQRDQWDLGDEHTLDSFGIKSLKTMPDEYPDFLMTLPYYRLQDSFILVHAGLNFQYGTPFEEKLDMMWIRHWYDDIDRDWLGDRIIVHGHTPQTTMDTRLQLANWAVLPVLNIDCGAFMRSKIRKGFGHLCAFELTEKRLYFQENVDSDCIY
jgi:serine/threonine protein phosphatase 1